LTLDRILLPELPNVRDESELVFDFTVTVNYLSRLARPISVAVKTHPVFAVGRTWIMNFTYSSYRHLLFSMFSHEQFS
jgi:hypothetical protein